MIGLHTLNPRPGSRHRTKRLGCGESSGHGKTSGKGHKGQKARSGGGTNLGFEGGQWPLIRRLPKRGFNNSAFRSKLVIVNVGQLSVFDEDSIVNELTLTQRNIVKGVYDGIKVLGSGDIKVRLNIQVQKISASAKLKIENAGGTVTILSHNNKTGNQEETNSAA